MKSKYNITGMTCSACAAHIEKAVLKLDGVFSVSVNLMTNTMAVEHDDSLEHSSIIEAVVQSGYGAESASEANTQKKEKASDGYKREERRLLARVLSSLILMLVLMYVAMGHMVGLPLPSFLSGANNAVSYALVQLMITLPVLYINRAYFINGFRNLIKRSPNMDTLIAIGAGASVVYGIVATFIMSYNLGAGNTETVMHYYHNLYYESAVMILALVTLGKYFEGKSKRRTSDAISKLIDLTPNTATVLRDGAEIIIKTEDLRVGDIVIVKAGEAISADGIISEGECYVDESAITGESLPVKKAVGDEVVGGTFNKSGYLKLCVSRIGADTTLSKIIELVENANATKAPISKIADKISGVFVPIVISIALLAFIIWVSLTGDFEFAFSIGVAVLVISCPCALGLATPVAIMVGTGKGAENGILIKSGEALETAEHIKAVILDKTGTITEGAPGVTDIIGDNPNELLRLAASVERLSEHPLGQAIANSYSGECAEALDFKTLSGKGVTANIDKRKFAIGNLKLMNELGIDVNIPIDNGRSAAEIADELSKSAKTPMFIGIDGSAAGIIAVADKVRGDSKEGIADIKSTGARVIMLTGDNENTAKAIADEVGIDRVYAGVLPEGKEEIVRKIQGEYGKAAFVGDGVNDAPALARADVGIAIGAGTDIAVESGDVVLVRNSLKDVARLIRLSRATIRNVKENLFWAFFYNTLGIPLAAGVLYPFFQIKLDPMIAALAMSLSSVCVVLNALRLKLFKPDKDSKGISRGKQSVNSAREEIQYADTSAIDNTVIKEIEMETIEIIIDGMSCAHCSKRVEEALNAIDGVNARVNLDSRTAYVEGGNTVKDEVLIDAVTKAGYDVAEIRR